MFAIKIYLKIKYKNRWNLGVFECVGKYHEHKVTSYATTISSLFIKLTWF